MKLTLMKVVKYLGVDLDEKLMRKTHVDNQVKKGMRTMWSGFAFIGKTWGLTRKLDVQLRCATHGSV